MFFARYTYIYCEWSHKGFQLSGCSVFTHLRSLQTIEAIASLGTLGCTPDGAYEVLVSSRVSLDIYRASELYCPGVLGNT